MTLAFSPEKKDRTRQEKMDEVEIKMLYSNTVTFYEHWSGILMNGNLVLPYCDNMWKYKDMIFGVLPETTLESFSYTSTYYEDHFHCFQNFPPSLKIIELANWRGVSTQTIDKLIAQDVECHHQYELPFSESGVPVYDDTQTYKLEDGYWLKL